ncbi:MAG: hypothetical protein ACE5GX_20580, partial [Thermoanaerobaculia bacterium]
STLFMATTLMFIACHGGESPTQPETPVAAGTLTQASPNFQTTPPSGESNALATSDTPEGFYTAVKSEKSCSPAKVQVCHLPPGNPANIQQICISENAVPAHLGHGDGLPGDPVPGDPSKVFDESCEPVDATTCPCFTAGDLEGLVDAFGWPPTVACFSVEETGGFAKSGIAFKGEFGFHDASSRRDVDKSVCGFFTSTKKIKLAISVDEEAICRALINSVIDANGGCKPSK